VLNADQIGQRSEVTLIRGAEQVRLSIVPGEVPRA